MHLMALHKVHVQIDYRARLPYHTLPSWWLLTVLFCLPFLLCLSQEWITSFKRLCCMIHGDWAKWISVLCRLQTSPQVAQQANAPNWLRYIYIKRAHTYTRSQTSAACHSQFTTQHILFLSSLRIFLFLNWAQTFPALWIREWPL